jgi:hypothetical protein
VYSDFFLYFLIFLTQEQKEEQKMQGLEKDIKN